MSDKPVHIERRVTVLDQRGSYPRAEVVPGASTPCAVCAEVIDEDTVVLVVWRKEQRDDAVYERPAWLHINCRPGAPEFDGIDNLDERLRANSGDIWTEDFTELLRS